MVLISAMVVWSYWPFVADWGASHRVALRDNETTNDQYLHTTIINITTLLDSLPYTLSGVDSRTWG